MLATPISEGVPPIASCFYMKKLNRIVRQRINMRAVWLIAFMISAAPITAAAATPAGTDSAPAKLTPAARAKQVFLEYRSRYQANPTNAEMAWQFARACFDLGEFAKNDAERAEVAETGIEVAKHLVKRQPNLAEAHYYLGMNLGQLARTKSIGALRLVDQMEVEFQASRRLKEKFDFAGSDRNLGMLYLEAPTIGSIGSRAKARHHLRRAVELEPDFPENRLVLAEAYARWGDTAAAVREFKALSDRWNEYRRKYAADDRWAVSWTDWNKRFQALKSKLAEAGHKLQAPHEG